jgi:hypothetical protein
MIKLTWAQVGLASEPGIYDTRHGSIEVTADDIWIWSKYPNAAFLLMQPSLFGGNSLTLGTFEFREDWNVPGDEK